MELLAPAGDWQAFQAALENGADAVYMGGKQFSARQNAPNFSDDDLKRAVELAHLKDRKVYVTVNTLIGDSEFTKALDYIWFLYTVGIDGVIIQDLGLMNATRSVLPQFRVHASTQMTIHNVDGVKHLARQGIKRVVLAREMSLEDLHIIRQGVLNVELEVFVHGAICYSYSGQCLFSSLVGGRSGNRGRCAQPCRLPYHLLRKGEPVATGGRYLLSPSDLALIDQLPELFNAGVDSLKIEGRMKRPEYVAVVTRAYREALDLLKDSSDARPPESVKQSLLKIFNRNFTSGYLLGKKHDFLSISRPNNRGIYIGRVVKQNKDLTAKINLSADLNTGDGLQVWVSRGKGPVFTADNILKDNKKVDKAYPGDVVTLQLPERVGTSDRVFKIHDEELVASAVSSIEAGCETRYPVDITVYIQGGKPLKLVIKDQYGNQSCAYTDSPAVVAVKRPLTEESLKEKVNRLGNTPFILGDFRMVSDGNWIIPFGEINEARRQAVESLLTNYRLGGTRVIEANVYNHNRDTFLGTNKTDGWKERTEDYPTYLSVYVNGLEPARQAVLAGADRIYIGLEGLVSHRRIRAGELKDLLLWGKERNAEIIPALPRIEKPSDPVDYRRRIIDSGADTILVGNLGTMEWCREQGLKFWVDYSLNPFNNYTLDYLLEAGAKGICVSPELTLEQLKQLYPLHKTELIIHGEIIVMISQYCMLEGTMATEVACPGFCRQADYCIEDEKGYRFPVDTDQDCRFYVFNSRTLCMVDELSSLSALHPASLRMEMRRADAGEVKKAVSIYRRVLDGANRQDRSELSVYKKRLEAISPSPFTKCHYYRGVE
ncbi:DUF3656 domain-containing U32 family peptidase [Syntrophomonas erecta]